MNRPSILLSTLAGALLAGGAASAATLQELNGPLLNQGQWRLTSLEYLYYSKTISEQANANGTGAKYNYAYNYYSINPSAAYGITNNLLLGVLDTDAMPYSLSYNDYLTPGGIKDYFKSDTKFQNMLGATLNWRPGAPWEIYSTAGRSNMDYYLDKWDLPYGAGLISSDHDHSMSSYVTAGATWLSDPKAGHRTTHNRADLDGLFNPLLDQGQAKTDLRFNYTRNVTRQKGSSYNSATGAGRVYSSGTDAYYLLATPWLSYGLFDALQVDALSGVYLPQPSHSRYHIHAYNIATSGNSVTSHTDTILTLAQYTPQLTITHRLNPQTQWYLRGNYSYARQRRNSVDANDTAGTTSLSGAVSGSESASACLGLYWISEPVKHGRPLAADLDGLKRPLLEEEQFKLELAYTSYRLRTWTAGGASLSSAYPDYFSRLSYGIADELQAYLSFEVVPEYSAQGGPSSKYTCPWDPHYGAGLTWRPSQSFQLYSEALVSPANSRKTKMYTPSGTLGAASTYEYDTASVYLGATWLW